MLFFVSSIVKEKHQNSKEKHQNSMENKTPEDHGIETDEFPLEFQCCVCLDLLYKPVVLACGHISCFWCVFKAMDFCRASACPVCRHPYNHFPCICQLLHFVLLKLYPEAYKRREKQVMEEEKELGHFSPQFDHLSESNNNSKELNIHSTSSHSATSPQTKLHPETCSIRDQVAFPPMDSSEIIVPDKDQITIQENSSIGNDLQPETCKQVTIADLQCAACKNLLFRPVVLNCGHVYCQSCIINLVDGIPRCQLCQSMHPYGFPKVCLVIEHFLEEQFSEIYAQRREAVLKQADCQHGSPSTCLTKAQKNDAHSSSTPAKDYLSLLSCHGPKIHFGIGCDSCGMWPLTGERYKCKDCSEKIGFDLCEVCYNTPSKFPGRFNQQHTAEHKFEIIQPADILNILRLQVVEAGEYDSDASEDQGDASHAATLEDQEGTDSAI